MRTEKQQSSTSGKEVQQGAARAVLTCAGKEVEPAAAGRQAADGAGLRLDHVKDRGAHLGDDSNRLLCERVRRGVAVAIACIYERICKCVCVCVC